MLVYQTIHLILNRLLLSSFLFVSFRFFIRLFFFSFFFPLCVIVVDVYDYCLWCVHFDQITNAWLCKAVFSNVLEREKERERARCLYDYGPLYSSVSRTKAFISIYRLINFDPIATLFQLAPHLLCTVDWHIYFFRLRRFHPSIQFNETHLTHTASKYMHSTLIYPITSVLKKTNNNK